MINSVKILFIIFSILNYFNCSNSPSCKIDAYFKKIRTKEKYTSLWHTLNNIEPRLEACINCHNYDKDFIIQDFRQMEVVSNSLIEVVRKEINLAKKFQASKYDDYSFRKFHLRSKIDNPIQDNINIDTIASYLNLKNRNDLIFRTCKSKKVINGFVIDSKFARLVGYTDENRNIKVLNISNLGPETVIFKNKLSQLLKKYKLTYVNYIEERIVDSDEILNYKGLF